MQLEMFILHGHWRTCMHIYSYSYMYVYTKDTVHAVMSAHSGMHACIYVYLHPIACMHAS